jgi:hypothetical protein
VFRLIIFAADLILCAPCSILSARVPFVRFLGAVSK